MTQGQGLIEEVLAEGQAQVIVTYNGRTGDLPDTISTAATHDDVRRMVEEALRTGGVRGIPAAPTADLSDFIVDPCPPNETTPHHRLLIRPKTGFGELPTRGEMSVMDRTGDTKVIWSRDNADEVAAAREQFRTLRGKGFAAFKVVGKNGDKGEQIFEFDPNAERIILVPPMAGG